MTEKESLAESQPSANMMNSALPTAASERPAVLRYEVLNPRTVGRPIHLVGKFAAQIRADLSDRFCAPLNHRYRASFEIGETSFAHSTTRVESQKRWLSHSTDSGRIWTALSRDLLLCMLRYRYGTYDGKAAAPADAFTEASELEPESASEERLAAMVGSQLASIVMGRIESLLPLEAAAVPAKSCAEIAEVCASVPTDDTWTLRVQITESERGLAGTLWLVLDERWMARLLKGLAPKRECSTGRAGAAGAPLPRRLQLKLVARLLKKEIPLGTLLDMSIGDVIPINLGVADVLIEHSRLFTASLAEHRGKICLTSFEDVE